MDEISQRELRNDNAAVIRAVQAGSAFVITRRGVAVARLTPLIDDTDLRCTQPATERLDYTHLKRARITTPTAELLEDLRGDR